MDELREADMGSIVPATAADDADIFFKPNEYRENAIIVPNIATNMIRKETSGRDEVCKCPKKSMIEGRPMGKLISEPRKNPQVTSGIDPYL